MRCIAANSDKLREPFFTKQKKYLKQKARGLWRQRQNVVGKTAAKRQVSAACLFFEFHACQMIAGYEIFAVFIRSGR
jgi:hypothetical protein